jgi:hypothetical protein
MIRRVVSSIFSMFYPLFGYGRKSVSLAAAAPVKTCGAASK